VTHEEKKRGDQGEPLPLEERSIVVVKKGRWIALEGKVSLGGSRILASAGGRESKSEKGREKRDQVHEKRTPVL